MMYFRRSLAHEGGTYMETANPIQATGKPPSDPFKASLIDAIRYWEPRRLVYNLVLTAICVVWIVATWPHFRPAMTLQTLLPLSALALFANLCYCAAYVVDIPMQGASFGESWKRRRWGLWLIGMLLAALFANYWIVDEIYPYVGA
jgi:hypothetical protein